MKKNIMVALMLLLVSLVVVQDHDIKIKNSTKNIKYQINNNLDFEPGTIMVVLDNECSGNNKVYSPNDFLYIGCESVEELTSNFEQNYDEDFENDNLFINASTFKRILKLILVDKSYDNTLEAINYLSSLDFVYSVEPNYYISLESFEEPKTIESSGVSTISSDEDDNSLYQWSLENINIPAYLYSFDDNFPYLTQETVKVGIIDSGIEYQGEVNGEANSTSFNHIDLLGKVKKDPYYSFYNDADGPFVDVQNHGTPIAGIIGADANNNIGIKGICNKVEMYSLKCYLREEHNIQNGSVSIERLVSSVSQAVNYAASKQINIINCSFGTYYESTTLEDIFTNFPSILFVCGSGNSNKNIDNNENKLFPASYELDNILTVGAIDSNDCLWVDEANTSFGSNYGQVSVDVFAPGKDIVSTSATYTVESTNQKVKNDYKEFTGTSFATPHVTALAAILKSISINYDEVDDISETNYCFGRTILEIKNAIISSARQVSSLADKCVSGGIIDVEKTIENYLNHNHYYEYYNINKHKILCSKCNYLKIEDHNWIIANGNIRSLQPSAIVTSLICSKCGATKLT